jgi:alkylated DNA nucleotide flippase Atl1
MSSAKEIASQVFPHFAEAVLAGKVRTYGYYARLIGRDVAKESITIGPAMHLIGAICVVQQLPVAPLHFVERADGQAREIFATDPYESIDVLPHFDTLYVVAREYGYSAAEFEKVGRALQKVMIEKAPPDWTPQPLGFSC